LPLSFAYKIEAVNNWGKLGKWGFHVNRDPQLLGVELAWLTRAETAQVNLTNRHANQLYKVFQELAVGFNLMVLTFLLGSSPFARMLKHRL
jgi:hypothetical protein